MDRATEKERNLAAEYGAGYRDGFVEGYQSGIKDGQNQGYLDAKWRAHRAVAGRSSRTRQAVTHYVGRVD